MTSTEDKPVLASKCDWPLYRSYDLDWNKNQMYLPKDPHMQNFRSFGPLGAELQTPFCHQDIQKTGLCCPPFDVAINFSKPINFFTPKNTPPKVKNSEPDVITVFTGTSCRIISWLKSVTCTAPMFNIYSTVQTWSVC